MPILFQFFSVRLGGSPTYTHTHIISIFQCAARRGKGGRGTYKRLSLWRVFGVWEQRAPSWWKRTSIAFSSREYISKVQVLSNDKLILPLSFFVFHMSSNLNVSFMNVFTFFFLLFYFPFILPCGRTSFFPTCILLFLG